MIRNKFEEKEINNIMEIYYVVISLKLSPVKEGTQNVCSAYEVTEMHTKSKRA